MNMRIKYLFCICSLAAFGACTKSEGTDTPEPVREQTLYVTHTNFSFVVPLLTGEGVTGTIRWGDGKSEPYAPDAVHNYEAGGGWSKTCSVDARNAEEFTIPELTGVASVDFSLF